jgi:hypothetical protein
MTLVVSHDTSNGSGLFHRKIIYRNFSTERLLTKHHLPKRDLTEKSFDRITHRLTEKGHLTEKKNYWKVVLPKKIEKNHWTEMKFDRKRFLMNTQLIEKKNHFAASIFGQ